MAGTPAFAWSLKSSLLRATAALMRCSRSACLSLITPIKRLATAALSGSCAWRFVNKASKPKRHRLARMDIAMALTHGVLEKGAGYGYGNSYPEAPPGQRKRARHWRIEHGNVVTTVRAWADSCGRVATCVVAHPS